MSANFTVGEGYSYSSIQLGIDAMPGDLSGQGRQAAQVYYKDADDHSVPYAETLDIFTGFSNGSATDYIDVGAMVSHGGMRDSGIIIDVTTAVTENEESGIILRVGYVRLHGFCVTGECSEGNGFKAVVAYGYNGIKVYDNIIYDISNTADNSTSGIYVAGGPKDDVSIFNNIIFNISCLNNTWYKLNCISANFTGNSGHPFTIANNTVLPKIGSLGGMGISVPGSYTDIINNYMGNSNGYGLDVYGTHTNNNIHYNISSDNSADNEDGYGGTNNLINKAAVKQFVNVTAGYENLRLLKTADCRRKGQNNSSLFQTDITGRLRGRWCTGAFEAYPYYQDGMIPPNELLRDNCIDNLKASLNPY